LHPWEKYTPSAYYFQHSERAWYEFIGSIWQTIKPSEPSSVEAVVENKNEADNGIK
ncbi:TPA: envelope biogenesis factor ElyC, partial [Proteus mirabilis]